jgi:serine/threonine-protein kinase
MQAAFTRLRVQPRKGAGECQHLKTAQPAHQLRREPVNVCGTRAQTIFAVNALFRPVTPVCSRLEVSGEAVFDRATGLVWQRQGGRYPVTFAGASQYVEQLNSLKFHGCSSWRLPTVNELLSLLPSDTPGVVSDAFPQSERWLWSCDRHGYHESWYVNMDMGFAGVQDVNCLNHVRAVATAAP